MNDMIRALSADEIDFVAGADGWVPVSFPSLTTLSVTKINSANQTGIASANGDVYQFQATGNKIENSAVIAIF